MRIFYYLIFITFFIPTTSVEGQSTDLSNLSIEEKISVESYTGGEHIFGDIISLNQLNDSLVLWANREGLIVIYDFKNHKVLDKILLDKTLKKVIFNKEQNTIIISCVGALLEYTFHNLKLKQKTLISESGNRSYHGLVASSDFKTIASITNDSTIYFWKKNKDVWYEEKMKVNFFPFSLVFSTSTDTIIYAGSNNGELFYIDILAKNILKKVKVFNETIIDISVSTEGKKVALTNGKKVKFCTYKLKSIRTAKSNIQLIGQVKWYDENQLIIAGNEDALEVWDLKKIKISFSYNINAKSKQKIEKKHISNPGISFFTLTDENFNSNYYLKEYSRITSCHINYDANLAIAFENFDVSTYAIDNEKLKPKYRMNLYDEIGKGDNLRIDAIEASSDKIISIGATYSSGTYNIQTKHTEYASTEHWYNNSQIDFFNFKDVDILKRDNKFKNYKEAIINFDITKGIGKRKNTKLFKKIRSKSQYGNVGIRSLLNPSGFNISSDKMYLIAFDALGTVQILNLKDLEIVVDDKLSNYPIKSAFFYEDNYLVVTTEEEGILLYEFKDNDLNLFERIDLNFEFDNVKFNQEDLVAFFDSNTIHIYDLKKREIVGKVNNKKENFKIDLVEFIPKKRNIFYVINEKGYKKQEPTQVYSHDRITSEIELIKDKKVIVTGNSNGDILIFSASQ